MKRGQALRVLFSVWTVFSVVDVGVVFIQSLTGKYEQEVSEVWAWLLGNLIPCFTIISIATWTDSAISWHDQAGNRFRFLLALGLSVSYLLATLLMLLVEPFTSRGTFAMIDDTTLVFAVSQGFLISAVAAVIFEGR